MSDNTLKSKQSKLVSMRLYEEEEIKKICQLGKKRIGKESLTEGVRYLLEFHNKYSSYFDGDDELSEIAGDIARIKESFRMSPTELKKLEDLLQEARENIKAKRIGEIEEKLSKFMK
jgi:hypothetical protein